jgi:hypothetical protein
LFDRHVVGMLSSLRTNCNLQYSRHVGAVCDRAYK